MEAFRDGAKATLTGQTVGSYQVLDRIGRGGMGDVYRALDTRLNRLVAVKTLARSLATDPHARKRFLLETRTACQVQHPYVATVFDVVEWGDGLLLVMELIEGRRLDTVLASDQPALQQVTGYALEIAEALGAIHHASLVHRDLKPGNVMVTPGGHVKVMDFGLARSVPRLAPQDNAAEATASEPNLTGEGVRVGTVNYMSPEQVLGTAVDHRSDFFSFGILVYEAITGQHPFKRDSVMATASAILNEPPGGGTEPRSLSESGPMRQIVHRLLEKDRKLRYPSAKPLVEDLRAVVKGENVQLRQWPSRRSSRVPWIAAAAAIAVLVLAGGGMLWRRYHAPGAVGAEGIRPMIAVLPFEDRTREIDGDLRAQMVSELVSGSLSETRSLRALGSQRVQDILGHATSASHQEALQRIRAAAKPDIVVGGSIYKDGDSYQAVGHVYRGSENEPREFRVAAAGSGALADVIAAKVRELVAPGGGDALPEADRLTSPVEEARVLERRARDALREHQYKHAIEFLEQAVAIDPQFIGAYVRLALALDRAGYGTRAREAADRALRLVERGSALPERLVLQSRAAHARVHESEEIGFVRALADRYPDEPDVLLELAVALRRGKKAEEALTIADRAVALDGLDPRAYMERARALYALEALDRNDDALAALDRAAELFRTMESKTGLAEVDLERGHVEFDRNRFAVAAEHYTTAADAFLGLGLEVAGALASKAAADAELMQGHLGVLTP